jgi:predicted RNase H-like nuclease (RuvC/YqgF family)
MRRIECMLALSAVILVSAMGAGAQSQSLGDYARALRKEKRPPAKQVYTNDNLPTSASISVVGPPAASAEEKPAAKPPEAKEKQAEKPGKTSEEQAPQDEQGWRDAISAQKKKVADLEHELDLLQREYKLQIADYYADAGTQMRDQRKWEQDDAKYQADIAQKQKQIQEAQAQLQDLKEQARKAGMPSSISE